MAETTFTTIEESGNRDLGVATMMLLGAIGMFWYLDATFHVSAYFWYSLLYLLLSLPFVSVVLHARPFTLKLSFWLVLAMAVFLL